MSLNRSVQFIIVGLAILLCCSSLIASPARAYYEPSVGVKKGDWIEYNISITGTPPPTHDVRWMRIEILPVQGAAFSVNLTARYANETIGSAVWKFNFTEGNVGGWMIIPSNLDPGDTFYDSSIHTRKSVNVPIQSQEQKTVLGASRTVTYGNDSFRHKEWDQATGVFVGSSEGIKNVTTRDGFYIHDLTVTIQAIATNMWSPETILGLKPTVFYALVATIIVLAVLILASVVVARRKKINTLNLSASSQAKIAVLTILFAILFEVANMLMSPFYGMGFSIAEINLIMQTLWTALVIVSMGFRLKGNYFLHEITMLIVMCAWWVGFSAVLLMNPFSTSTEVFSNTPLRLVMNALHAIFSIPALIFGTWLVGIWRPASTTFPAKSRRIAQLTTIFWIPSYVVGVLDFMVLHTTVFG
ncbi:MAG: hypothetical protein JSW44_01750 [Candidatus Bathyarchaeota archaeon]|nr:MAG: hypothetical protein JSW44_01750 [Candidatus Bathyarchaeota archaeon]